MPCRMPAPAGFIRSSSALRSAGLPSIGVFTDSTDRSMPIVDLAMASEDPG